MVATEKTQAHLPELDGIRGLAILGVLCSHGAGLSGIFCDSGIDKLFRYCMVPLWGGVDLFFALSGFLITGILLGTKDSRNYFSSFYARRILRIFPIYYLVLTVSLILAACSASAARYLPPTTSWKLAYFLYLQNLPAFWDGQKIMGGVWGAYWSLAVEEQFYFVWPLLVYLLSPKSIMRVCIVGFTCALPLRFFMSAHFFGDNFGLAQITSSRMDGLLLGSACAIYMHQQKRPVPIKYILASIFVGASVILFIGIYHHTEFVSTSKWILTIGITGFALLSGAMVALSQHHIAPIQRILTLSWLRSLGKYSYGIYVYHLFVIISLSRVIARHPRFFAGLNFPLRLLLLILEFGIVFLIAKLSYDYVESRFLRLKRFFGVGPKLPSAALSSLKA